MASEYSATRGPAAKPPEPDKLQGFREDETYQRAIDELGLGE